MAQRISDIATGIYSKFKPVDVKCSCPKCESMYCFAKRNEIGSCSCENCKESKTCLFYNNRIGLKKSRSDATNAIGNIIIPATGDNIQSSFRGLPPRYTSEVTTNTVNNQSALELCKNLILAPRNTIGELKNKYLSPRNRPTTSSQATQVAVYTEYGIANYDPNYTLDVKSGLGAQKSAAGSLKNLPQKDPCACDVRSQQKPRKANPRGYIFDLKAGKTYPHQPDKPKPTKMSSNIDQVHVLDQNWNTIETPENTYLMQKNSCDCSDCLNAEHLSPKYLVNPPGYVLELQKSTDVVPKKSQEGYYKTNKQTKTNESSKNKYLAATGSCCCIETAKVTDYSNNDLRTYKSDKVKTPERKAEHMRSPHQPAKSKPIKSPINEIFCMHILDRNWNTIETPENAYLVQKYSCDCSDCLNAEHLSPKYLVNPPGYVLELQKSHETAKKSQETYGNTPYKQTKPTNSLNDKQAAAANSYCCREAARSYSKDALQNEIFNNDNYASADKSKRTKKPPGYVVDLKTDKSKPIKSQPITLNMNYMHILDKNWNTIETPGNKYLSKKENCSCSDCFKSEDQSPKYLVNPPGYVLELQKSNVTTKKSQETCGSTLCKENKPTESLKDRYTTAQSSCSCNRDASSCSKDALKSETFRNDKCTSDKSKTIKKPPGYVLDLKTEKPNLNKTNQVQSINYMHILDNNWNTIETPGNAYSLKKDSCTCSDCLTAEHQSPKYLVNPPGYVLELQTKTKKSHGNNIAAASSCNCKETAKVTDESKNTQKSCVSGMHRNNKHENKKHSHESKISKLDLCRHILEIQKYTMETLDSIYSKKKKGCYCDESPKQKPEPTELIIEFPECNCKQSQSRDKYKQKTDKQKCDKGKSELLGYMYESKICSHKSINNYKGNHNLNNCNCNNDPNPADSPGYTNESLKYKPSNNAQELFNNILGSLPSVCDKNCAKNKEKPPGYVVDLSQDTNKKTSKKSLKTNKSNCECNESAKNNTESSGHVCQLQRYKSSQEPGSNTQVYSVNRIETLNNTFQKKKSCDCNVSVKNSKGPLGYEADLKKDCECNESVKPKLKPPGYVVDLPVTPRKSCECNVNAKKSPKDETGYIYDLQHYKSTTPEPVNNNQVNKLMSNLNNLEIPNNCNKVTCECKESKRNKSLSGGYVVDLSKYTEKQINNTTELFKNILHTQTNAIETLTNEYQKKKGCECNVSAKNKPEVPGYVFDLPKKRESIDTTKKKCECNASTKTNIESPGYTYELEKNGTTNDPVNKTQVYSINSLDTKQKNTLTTPKKSCECNESARNKSDPSGYVSERPERVHQRTCRSSIDASLKNSRCGCNASSKRNSASPGYVVDIPKNVYEPSKNTQELCQSILETLGDTFNNTYDLIPTDLCNCEPNKTSKVTEYLCEKHALEYKNNNYSHEEISGEPIITCKCPESPKTKNTQESTMTDEIYKGIFGTQTNTTETLSQKYNQCMDKQKDSIQAVKNIYLPPKYTVDYSKKYEQSFNEQQSTEICNELCPESGKLSPEVIESNDTVSRKQFDISNKPSKLTKYDIFKRIREAYKACSCKVCECIAGKMVKSDLCNCKPCECNECMSYLEKIDIKLSYDGLGVGSNYPCEQCAKTLYQTEGRDTNKREICNCKPCECLNCTINMSNICDCEPCQCVECRPKSIHPGQTLVVAPVGEPERVACTCSPCDCIECGQVYPLTPNVRHEMSTGTNRHALCRCEICLDEACDQSGVDSCKCERRNKVMSKPVERDLHDFDIRTATVIHNKFLQHDGGKRTRHDTIAMFAAIPNKYPSFASDSHRLSTTRTCSCEECECISCACKENAINAIKSSQLFPPYKVKTVSHLNVHNKSKLNNPNECKCEPCECQICKKQDDIINHINRSIYKKSCVCDTCDCISCEGEKRLLDCASDASCKCSTCECADCWAKIPKNRCRFGRHCRCSICRCERCYERTRFNTKQSVKKGDLLSPSTHKSKIQSIILEKRYFVPTSSSIHKLTLNKYPNTKIRDVSFFDALPNHYNENASKHPTELNTSVKLGSITLADNVRYINDCDTKYAKKSEVLKCDAYMQRFKGNKEKSLHRNNSIDNENSGSYFSGCSSFETTPKTSYHKDLESITPNSQIKNKSWESSCNSSGHDYPEYLIQFPKSTVETCLKDVMELDVDKAITLDKFKMITNSTPKSYFDQISYDSISGEEKQFTQGYNFLDTSNSKPIATAGRRKEITKQYGKNNDNRKKYSEYTQELSSSRRNYRFELSNSLHVHLNKEKEKHQNCNETIDTQNNEKTQQNIDSVRETWSSIMINNEKRNYTNVLKKINEFRIARKLYDYNVTERNTANTLKPIYNEAYRSRKYSKEIPHSLFISRVDIFNVDEDYKSVQKTLKEAKEFSLELMRLLEMYDKANKEFESISDNLKMSHTSLITGNFVERKEICSVEEVTEKCLVKEKRLSEIEHELQEIHLEVPSVREKLTSTSILQEKGKLSGKIVINSNHDNKTTLQKLSTYKNISNYQKVNESIVECDPHRVLNSVVENNILERIETQLKKEEKIIKHHENVIENEQKPAKPVSKQSGTTEGIVSIPDNRGMRKKERVNNKNYRKYSKLLKRTIIISKRVSVKNPIVNESRPLVKYCVTVGTSTTLMSEMNTDKNDADNILLSDNKTDSHTENEQSIQKHKKDELHRIMRKLDTVFGSIEEVPVSTSTDTYGLEPSIEESELVNHTIPQELEESKPWPILKKNYSWNRPCTKSKEVCIFPSLELEIKQAVQSISLQTTQPKKKPSIPHHENKALANLQYEVKKLLDMPILQPQDSGYYRPNCSKEILNKQHKNKLDLELKETPQLSLETYRKDVNNVDKEVSCNFKVNQDLEAQIRELLNLSVLLPLIKNKMEMDDEVETNTRMPSVGGNSSCEALKVAFLGVRRVSDHTVLVKWNVPRVIDKVKGYELLVDGRAVQKIFSPSKCMAVVTCLPHTDKVLLTIRTITTNLTVNGHYPATTVIYRPRVK